ncbi:MAG: FAD-binding protein [Anaerovoracaceae bacterium]
MKEILIVGNGLAGLSAAAEVVKQGHRAIIVSPMPANRAQSVMAAGGINAALNTKGEDDSPQEHCQDTLKAGVFLGNEEAIRNMTAAAPELIGWLSDMGMVFSRDGQGNPDCRYFGGQKKKRTVFSKSGIGKQLISALSQYLRKYEAEGQVVFMENCSMVQLIQKDGMAAGIVAYNLATDSFLTLGGEGVIIATGGMIGIFGKTTGSVVSDGSVTALLYGEGCGLSNGEMIQYHPTTIETKQKRMLISEAARGEGGRLFAMKEGKPWYFMEEWFPEGGNLMPRDVVSKSIYQVIQMQKEEASADLFSEPGVWLDISFLPKEVIEERLEEITALCQDFLGLDPAKEPIPVYPGIHYFMGGLYVDNQHRTTMNNLFAAGECCALYHGANRLGGNSTLGAIYGGKIAAQTCLKEGEKLNLDQEPELFSDSSQEGVNPLVVQQQMHCIMNEAMGIIRDEAGLLQGLAEIERLKAISLKCLPTVDRAGRENMVERIKTKNFLNLAEALLKSALAREESRGAHQRKDFPEKVDKQFEKLTLAQRENGQTTIVFCEK